MDGNGLAEHDLKSEWGVPDVPITSTLEYQSRTKAAARHFGFFPYMSKKPWRVVQEYITHFSAPGELVVDPFAGSGVTGVEALILRRRAILMDVNPLARFIAKMTAVAPVDLDLLKSAYAYVEQRAREGIEAVLVDVDRQPTELIPDLDYPMDEIPKSVRRAGLSRVYELHTPRQLVSLAILRAAIFEVEDEISRNLLLVAFGNTVRYANRTYSVTSDRTPYRGNANFLRRFSFSPAKETFHEHQVWPTFERTFKSVLKAKEETNRLLGSSYSDGSLKVSAHSAWDLLKVVRPESVDYIFTDPPYANDIHFMDLSILWSSWLRLMPTSIEKESSLENMGDRSKEFRQNFEGAIHAMATSLKPGRWLTLVYKHHNFDYWNMIVAACESQGLRYINSVNQKSNIRSTRQIEASTLNPSGDIYLNFRKIDEKSYKRIYSKPDPVPIPTGDNFLKFEVQRIVVTYLGADTGLLIASLLNSALNTGALPVAGGLPWSTNLHDVLQVSGDFARWTPGPDKEEQWIIAPGTALDSALPFNDRLRYRIFEHIRIHDSISEREANELIHRILISEPNAQVPSITELRLFLNSLGTRIQEHQWKLEPHKLLEYKQLRWDFGPSTADLLARQIEGRSSFADIRVEGLMKLLDLMDSANQSSTKFRKLRPRVLDTLQTILRRTTTRLGPLVAEVRAVGPWASDGVSAEDWEDEELVLAFILTEQPSASTWDIISDKVFVNLDDEEMFVQFVVYQQPDVRESDEFNKNSIILLGDKRA